MFSGKRLRFSLLMTLMLVLLTSACGLRGEESAVRSEKAAEGQASPLTLLLPGQSISHTHGGELRALKKGSPILTDEILAAPCIELGIAEYWYPQYLATVVIAIDRAQTECHIAGWHDLLEITDTLGMSDTLSEARLILSALSYGLEGQNYTLEGASALLSALYRQERLQLGSDEAAVLICFDDQAAMMRANGRPMEIVIPAEGTLSFEKGILSPYPLNLPAESEELCLHAGFRLADGRSLFEGYPADYRAAVRVEDPAYAAKVFDDTTFALKRKVQNIGSYLYSSDDGRGHQFFGLSLIILVILWTGHMLRRVMHSSIRRAILIMAILLIGWMLLRMFKYQIPLGTLNMYCWYSYYFFRLSLPLAGIWLSYAIDRPNDTSRPPKWWYVCAVYNFILIALVLSNNLHYQAFIFDPQDPNYNIHFSYGPVYYLAMISLFAELLIMQMMIIVKGWKSPRKRGFVGPIIFYALIGLYCVGYIMRVPVIWETDSTMVSCMFVLIFTDLCIRSGLIPVNSKYKALFARSPLNMQILSASGDIAVKSGAATQIRGEGAAFRAPDENTLLYQSKITGGAVVWQEDISSLNRLHQEIFKSNQKLKAANAILSEEERIKSQLAATEARSKLFSELEEEIQKRTLELYEKIETLEERGDDKSSIAVITLLLCYLKRRCILFFRERETEDIPLDEIVVYLDELSEFAALVGIRLHVLSILYTTLPTREGTLFYDFVYLMLEWAIAQQRDTLLLQILSEEGRLIAKCMCGQPGDPLCMENSFSQAVNAAGGGITLKDMDDVMSVWLSFPKGGGKS